MMRRAFHVHTREVDGVVFLINGEDGTISYLNELGGALWRVLAEPMTEADLIALFVAAFPDRASATVADDVLAMLDDLRERGLLGDG